MPALVWHSHSNTRKSETVGRSTTQIAHVTRTYQEWRQDLNWNGISKIQMGFSVPERCTLDSCNLKKETALLQSKSK